MRRPIIIRARATRPGHIMKNIFLIFLFLFTSPAFANEITHAIGDTGYMIREAMQAGAAKKDTQNYQAALQLQKEAKARLRGTHKKGRNVQLALELTHEAYAKAKQARDNSFGSTQGSTPTTKH